MISRLKFVLRLGLFLALVRPDLVAETNDPDKDSTLPKLLEEARRLIDAKKPQAAIDKCDKVISLFKDHYAAGKEKVYCARTSAESLGYLLQSAAEIDKGVFEKGKGKAIVLSGTWASAYFMKGYALQELGLTGEAKSALQLAIGLSPWNSQCLSELGSVYKMEKNWKEAKKAYEAAEEHAGLAPDSSKAFELGVARRGLGYVLVELGQINEAEKKYLECLRDDPHDTKAAAELEYVRKLKAKKRGQLN